ncbi:hypothetical protein GFL38_10410 [Rhizobium leguminosarum bv. viciae]|uniref:hypothetical protein n=1 Tax=Rhizobium ruizarguesonis TaxID=2081791 RepID=UPI00143F3465|nr:hypothetical protein [Rhizobium ruizarguesonis]NKJ72676.1 hypothetical protein [Rhizobium leguminosarum bv. viciae]NKQ80354.1 hypothetical protein [Rhizobium ruizarguesonis]
MMETAETRVAAVAAEIQGLAPHIAQLEQRVRAVITAPQIAALEGRERAETLLPCEIGAEALGRCRILVANNVVVLETLGVISLTRYVFELLVWLRTIHQVPMKSLRFIMLSLKDGEDHISEHIAHLEAEAQFLDEMAERDNPVPGMKALSEEHGKNLTAELVHNFNKARMDAIDFEARRHFVAYAADARVNGYGFQAHLIRKKAVAASQADLEAKRQVRLDFVSRFGQTLIDEAGGVSKWNWFDSAKAVGMEPEYQYIYRYTSRLLHATPTSFYTASKNLELSEMRLLLEYVYVRLLDVIDVVTDITVRAEEKRGSRSN